MPTVDIELQLNNGKESTVTVEFDIGHSESGIYYHNFDVLMVDFKFPTTDAKQELLDGKWEQIKLNSILEYEGGSGDDDDGA